MPDDHGVRPENVINLLKCINYFSFPMGETELSTIKNIRVCSVGAISQSGECCKNDTYCNNVVLTKKSVAFVSSLGVQYGGFSRPKKKRFVVR